MSKLQTTARTMRTALTTVESGWNAADLPERLQVVLSRQGEQWRLALRREGGTPPSYEEARVCAEAFEVPEGTEPKRRGWVEKAPGRTVRINTVEMMWRER